MFNFSGVVFLLAMLASTKVVKVHAAVGYPMMMMTSTVVAMSLMVPVVESLPGQVGSRLLNDDACGSPNDPCMNSNNWSQCKMLLDAGCQEILLLESCPLQFACADEDFSGGSGNSGSDTPASSFSNLLRDNCFSPYSKTIIKGDREGRAEVVFMKDIVPGDKVLTASGEYKTIYTIDHHNSTEKTTFLQIQTEKLKNEEEDPIELTPRHMLYIDGQPTPVTAGSIKIGDSLQTLFGPRKVIKIDMIVRDGLYNPLTTDGTIIVNGIMASTYSSFDSQKAHLLFDLISANTAVHIASIPYGMICTSTSLLALCNQHEEYSAPSLLLQHAYKFMFQQHQIVQFVIVLCYLFLFIIINLMLKLYPYIVNAVCFYLCRASFIHNLKIHDVAKAKKE